jgi:3-(3-hydroxy-phenyl)propionate hydroxylase
VLVEGRRCRLDDVLGDGSAVLEADGEQWVVRRDDGTEARVEEPTGALTAWARGATVIEIRPDRIVRSARAAPA